MTAWTDVECEHCLGTGTITETCTWCDGAGDGNWPDEPECLECGGHGELVAGDCVRCEGAGWWSVQAPESRPCRACGQDHPDAFRQSDDFCEGCLPGILREVKETGGY